MSLKTTLRHKLPLMSERVVAEDPRSIYEYLPSYRLKHCFFDNGDSYSEIEVIPTVEAFAVQSFIGDGVVGDTEVSNVDFIDSFTKLDKAREYEDKIYASESSNNVDSE